MSLKSSKIIKAIKSSKPSDDLRKLYEEGVLLEFFPEFKAAFHCEQNEYHAETVFEHLMYVVDAAAELTDNYQIRLAAFLHDYGKPATKTTGKDGRIHFFKHEIVGPKLAEEGLIKLNIPFCDIKTIKILIRNHQWRFEENTKEKTLLRFLYSIGPENWPKLVVIRMADRKGNLAKKHKSQITTAMLRDNDRIMQLINNPDIPIFIEDVNLTPSEIKAMGLENQIIFRNIFPNLLGLITLFPDRNNKKWLTDYVKRNYLK